MPSTSLSLLRRMAIIDVAGDGVCLFRVVSIYFNSNKSKHLVLRADTDKYMRTNAIYCKDITACDPDKNLQFEKYLDKIEKLQQMVREYVLRAIANVFSKPLRIRYCQCVPWVYYPVSSPVNNSDCESFEVINIENCVNLLYNNCVSIKTGHYKALVKNMECNASPGTVPVQKPVNLLLKS